MTGCSFDWHKIADAAWEKVTGQEEEIEQEEDTEEYIHHIPEAEIQAEADRVAGVICDAFSAKNADILKELFSEYTHEQHNLDEEIADAFKFLDGEIVSIGDIQAGYSGGSNSAKYGEVETKFSGTIYDVVTENGKNYSIYFDAYYNYRLHDDRVGVYGINVIDEAVSINRAGERPGGKVSIGGPYTMVIE